MKYKTKLLRELKLVTVSLNSSGFVSSILFSEGFVGSTDSCSLFSEGFVVSPVDEVFVGSTTDCSSFSSLSVSAFLFYFSSFTFDFN